MGVRVMPVYEYECTKCKHRFDKLKSFSQSDEPERCPQCRAPARRALSQVNMNTWRAKIVPPR